MDLLLEAKGLKRHFPAGSGKVEVLRGIDLAVKRGELVSVVGQSGAGKSTLLHILGALDRPSEGTILYEGENLFDRSEAELAAFRNKKIGFVFQFHHLLPEFSALENASMPARIAGLAATEAMEAARELLVAVGLEKRLDHRPSQLSGGEQQRVALARALVLKPDLLLADEPTGNLDHQTGEVVHELLLELNKIYGVTLVVATHNKELAMAMERVITIEDGLILKEEIVEDN